MSLESPVLSRGRGGVLALCGALVVAFATGWLRQVLLDATGGLVMAIPWVVLRRMALGCVYELPTVVVVVALLAASGRVLVLRPWRASTVLVATVWLLDVTVAWLVADDLGLWTDALVAGPRLVVLCVAATAGAFALGWRPRQTTSA